MLRSMKSGNSTLQRESGPKVLTSKVHSLSQILNHSNQSKGSMIQRAMVNQAHRETGFNQKFTASNPDLRL